MTADAALPPVPRWRRRLGDYFVRELRAGRTTVPYYSARLTPGSLRSAAALLLLGQLVLGLIVGCDTAPSPTHATIVVAASATANEPAPVFAAGDRALLAAAGAGSTDAVAYVVNTATGQPASVTLTPRRPDGQVEYGPRRSNLIAQNVDQVQRLLSDQAATRPFDLLSLIGAAVRVTSPPATLLVVSSGLSTAGGFDLRQVGWAASPAAVATALKQAGLLPRLAGWKVVFSGLGDTAGRQPSLPLPQQTTLAAYWMAICRTAGAAACSIDDTIRPDPAPRSITPVPVVPIPAVLSVTGPHGAAGISVPAEEFFAFASASLLPGASAILAPIAARARAGHQLVSITGFASPDGGTTAYNDALSAARAQAVKDRLLALGVPTNQITRVTGAGTAGTKPQACYQDGQLDEAACAALRRVVILLTPQQAPTS
jgi:outer membrane protein OmpA-like peptidoglycan-associated protein